MTFDMGDRVEIVCSDGATFAGVLNAATQHYIIIDGRGYASDGIAVMRHA